MIIRSTQASSNQFQYLLSICCKEKPKLSKELDDAQRLDKSHFVQELLISSIENFFKHDLDFFKKSDKKTNSFISNSHQSIENDETMSIHHSNSNTTTSTNLNGTNKSQQQQSTKKKVNDNDGDDNDDNESNDDYETKRTHQLNDNNHQNLSFTSSLSPLPSNDQLNSNNQIQSNQSNQSNNNHTTSNNTLSKDEQPIASSNDVIDDLKPNDLVDSKATVVNRLTKNENASNEPNNDEPSTK